MGGLSNLFKKITPFIMLICFICFGITYAFKPTGAQNLTYLKTEYYNINTGNIIENPTNQQKETAEKLYTFDMVSYVNNMDIDILTRSTKDVININAYTKISNNFGKLWDNGYQVGDITKTILNAVLMVVNTIILIINIFLFPLRIISGILLTGMSLIGININNGIIIIPFLKIVIDNFKIPFINPANEKQLNQLTDTTWTFDREKIEQNAPSKKGKSTYLNINFSAYDRQNREKKYTQIEIYRDYQNKINIYYNNKEDSDVVYTNGWYNTNYSTITILDKNLTQEDLATSTEWLNKFANKNT